MKDNGSAPIGKTCPHDSIVVWACNAFPEKYGDANRYGMFGNHRPYHVGHGVLWDNRNTFLNLAEVCPNWAVAGPGYDAVWDEPGLNELTTPLFKHNRDQDSNDNHHVQGLRAMSGYTRGACDGSNSAHNLQYATKQYGSCGSTLALHHGLQSRGPIIEADWMWHRSRC